jgi:hypothetical protein
MLTVKQLRERGGFTLLNRREPDADREISSVYCCDLLSVVMGKAPAGSAWVTVMGNLNVVAVSALADTACVIVADGADVEDRALDKADEQGVILLRSAAPVFETAKLVDGLL